MKISVRPSHIIVIAAVALALTFGSAAAGAVAGAKWINGHDIKPHSIPANRLQGGVKAKQITGKIKGDRIAAKGITNRQLANDSVTTDTLTDDAVEELQPTVEYVDNVFDLTYSDFYKQIAAPCPAGTQAVGGYVKPGSPGDRADTTNAYVDPTQNAYIVRIATAETSTKVTVQTICLR